MKLSEAIREGCKLSAGQAFGKTADGGKTCAIGAAWEWAMYNNLIEHGDSVFKLWPDGRCVVDAPCGCRGIEISGFEGFSKDSLGMVIAHLNDDHKWSREAISEWVEVAEADLVKFRLRVCPPMPSPEEGPAEAPVITETVKV